MLSLELKRKTRNVPRTDVLVQHKLVYIPATSASSGWCASAPRNKMDEDPTKQKWRERGRRGGERGSVSADFSLIDP